ncbi:MAG: glycoside hydrolase family 32 protein [Planctomycetaceae bacterium]|nr:glycoside hydrolase family 32 protein [Planctomycetaceae bacterium]MCB9952093.1 glycoside hydrolase family 32 protein [Planctomycetaceae bacterium]
MHLPRLVFLFGSFAFCLTVSLRAEDVLIEDFESGTYSGWDITGDAFGDAPAEGALDNQMAVSGYRGKRLINSYYKGDTSTGTATSSPFRIERPHIALLIGGGRDEQRLAVQLLVDDKIVRVATGDESEDLEWSSWDVKDLLGKQARVRIIDEATGGWGHINVDHIMQTDEPPARFDLEHKLAEYRLSANYLNEPLRPQYHFSPEINWMNDPNGLVYHDGEYHLFYQYNPAGNSWGHMSWGHAVSKDLSHWEHLPLAIPEADGIMAFSGCCVVDHNNTSGFGVNNQPPMVAIYTGHGHGKQVQNIAYSNDRGRTWTQYANNPVLDRNNPDFRDPKVFWHDPTNRWVMVVTLAAEKVLLFYSSSDLKNWTELSRFGPAGQRHKPNWECPDLFQLPVEGEPGKKLWALEADMGSGSIAGGSGGEYFVGEFDGTKFSAYQSAQWVDFGRDFYAPVSWSDIPDSDGRRMWLGWFNNWETCLVPTSPWRSSMSIPRVLSLRKVTFNNEEPAHYVLIQQPVEELKQLRFSTRTLDTNDVRWPPVALIEAGDLQDMTFELEATLTPGNARSLGIRIRTGEEEFTEVGYDQNQLGVYVDRRKSGNVDFHSAFPGRHDAPARLVDGSLKLRIFVDRSTIEVFVNDGEAVISDRVFPSSQQPLIEAFCGDETAKITNVQLHQLKSVWRE